MNSRKITMFIVTTCAACWLTPTYPTISVIASNAHHSRHSKAADGKPSFRYSLRFLVVDLFGQNMASSSSGILLEYKSSEMNIIKFAIDDA